MQYTIQRAAPAPALDGSWDDVAWKAATPLTIGNFHARSSVHHPGVNARLLYDETHLHLMYRVQDRYVRCTATNYQDSVCGDSCVEFFVEPATGKGYFNFEFNCGGALLLYYIEDPRRTGQGFAKWRPVDVAEGRTVAIQPSLPKVIDPEIADPLTWTLAARIPYTVFRPYIGTVTPRPGDTWRANLYKCADRTSHPHWASWAPIGDELNFHLPQYFGTLLFA